MANINKISVSGTIYDIQDQHASKTVELTQAEYNGLSVKDPNTFYIITDAQGGDLSNYYTKGETDTLLGEKQPTLVSGTNIKTINNESLLGEGNIDIQGGGGKAVNAGTNISITTGETADTINCTLPISTDGDYSGKGIVIGNGNGMRARGACSIVGGDMVSASTNAHYSVGFGEYINLNNKCEFSSGRYSVTNSASSTFGDSGNTLFSVGNGTAANARHNAFEIRQNGDIYCSDGTNDVKLQDTITATAANTAALGGLKLVKLTQSQYDALQTKDANTLFIIVN